MRWTIVFFPVLLWACSDASRPKDVLPQEKMEAVLYDVIRADEMVNLLQYSDSTFQPFAKRTALYDTVFQLHGVKKAAFEKSLAYYQERPDLLKEIIEGMQQRIADTTIVVKPLQRAE